MSTREWYDNKMASDPSYFKKKRDRIRDAMNDDPYKFAANKYTKQKSAAVLKRGLAWRLDREKTIKLIAESTSCQLSGRPLIHKIGNLDAPSIDRINSNNGYTKRNIQIVSTAVNLAKRDMTDQEFIKMCCDVADHYRGKKRQ
jgi:hypothetical protein